MEDSTPPFFAAGDPDERLRRVLEIVREMSLLRDPQEVLRAYLARAKPLIAVDRSISLSRRGLEYPNFRVTRNDRWTEPIDPWKHPERLPVLGGGLLADLIYGGEPRLLNDLRVAPDDPAADAFAGMGSAVAIPHFDAGVAQNMVVHMRRHPAAFPADEFPQFVLFSSFFGRAMQSLVAARDLERADHRLREQYKAVSELSDTVVQQAMELKRQARALEQRVRERTGELRAANLDAIYMLALASEAKDEDTGRHLRRMQGLSRLLAEEVGMGGERVDTVGYAAVLHDVGKLHVPDGILKKPGPLDDDERRLMQRHTTAGERILSDRPFFDVARRVARSHHENWDGSGYPDGLAADHIPLEARIVHLADVYDALTCARVYKPAWPEERAVDTIRDSAGKMFDPVLVRAFTSVYERGELHRENAVGAKG